MGTVITCITEEGYHSHDVGDGDKPINLEIGDSIEVSDAKADLCKELVGMLTVEGDDSQADGWEAKKLAELRSEAKARKLDASGSKAEIAARLAADDQALAEAAAAEERDDEANEGDDPGDGAGE